MTDPMADYYTFMLIFSGFVILPLYIIIAWKNYYREKQREKTLRQAMRNGN